MSTRIKHIFICPVNKVVNYTAGQIDFVFSQHLYIIKLGDRGNELIICTIYLDYAGYKPLLKSEVRTVEMTWQ